MLWWRQEMCFPIAEVSPVGKTGELVRLGFLSSLMRVQVGWLIGGACLWLTLVLVTASRWWFLMRIQDVDVSLWETQRLTFLGQFFNVVVPGTVGGDLVKAYYVAKHTDRKVAVILSIFVDRVIGLMGLTLFSLASVVVLLLRGVELEAIRTPLITLGIVVVLLLKSLLVMMFPRLRQWLGLSWLARKFPMAGKLAALAEAAAVYRKHAGKLCIAVAITLACAALLILSILVLGVSLSLPIPWYNYFLYVPLIYIIGAVPLTPGGIGLVENFYLVFFSYGAIGGSANASEVVALALLARLIPILWSLPGALVAVTGPKLPSEEKMEAELGLRDSADPSSQTP